MKVEWFDLNFWLLVAGGAFLLFVGFVLGLFAWAWIT